MRRARPGDVRGEIVAHQRQRVRRQTEKLHILQVNVVVRAIDIFQRQIAHVPPAVRLARQKCNAPFQRGRQFESGKNSWQRRQRQFIDRV